MIDLPRASLLRCSRIPRGAGQLALAVILTASAAACGSENQPPSSSEVSAGSTQPQSSTDSSVPSEAARFDPYGGATATQLDATGWFRTAEIDGRSWLITPDGHPFFSIGVNHVSSFSAFDPAGNPAYGEAVIQIYGDADEWANAMVGRFAQWGVNTVGAWSEADLSRFSGRVPYTVVLGLGRPDDDLQDVFDPEWIDDVTETVDRFVDLHGNDPWLVGYFTDNEIPWFSFESLLDHFLQMPLGTPGNSEVHRYLQERYESFADLKADFPDVAANDWATFEEAPEGLGLGDTEGAQATVVAWSAHVAAQYFEITSRVLKDADPNHLNIGSRFVAQSTPRPVAEAAAPFVDVVSVDFYDLAPEVTQFANDFGRTYGLIPVANMLEGFHDATGRPLLVGEFSYRAADAGLPNTNPEHFLVLATQADRSRATANFMQCGLNTSYLVGAHWFELVDQPAEGRMVDGEDNNFGLLNENDEPYGQLIDAVRTAHTDAYMRLDDPSQILPCSPIGESEPGE